MNNTIAELESLLPSLADENSTPKRINIHSSEDNYLLATMLALGYPLDSAYENSIHRLNPAYASMSQATKIKHAKEYINKNPSVIKTIQELKNNFTHHYTKTLQISKEKIMSQIDKLSELATDNKDFKTALECLKTIGTELGMFQNKFKVEHQHTTNNTQIIELIQNNVPVQDTPYETSTIQKVT